MLTGLFLLIIHLTCPPFIRFYGTLFGLVVISTHSILRKIYPKFNENFIKSYGFLLRPHEKNNLPGCFYFIAGCFFTVAFYPEHISILALTYLSFGDPLASLCGIYFKSPTIRKGKTVAGTVSCAIVCSVLSVILLKNT